MPHGRTLASVFRRRFQLQPGALRVLFIVSLGGLASLALVVVAATVLERGLPTGSHVRRFDSRVWRDPTSSHDTTGDLTARQKMLGDVVENALPGRSRTEIEAILGPPSDTGNFAGLGHDLIYVTGPERGPFSIDSEWLLIWLDEQGRFERFEVTTD